MCVVFVIEQLSLVKHFRWWHYIFITNIRYNYTLLKFCWLEERKIQSSISGTLFCILKCSLEDDEDVQPYVTIDGTSIACINVHVNTHTHSHTHIVCTMPRIDHSLSTIEHGLCTVYGPAVMYQLYGPVALLNRCEFVSLSQAEENYLVFWLRWTLSHATLPPTRGSSAALARRAWTVEHGSWAIEHRRTLYVKCKICAPSGLVDTSWKRLGSGLECFKGSCASYSRGFPGIATQM